MTSILAGCDNKSGNKYEKNHNAVLEKNTIPV